MFNFTIKAAEHKNTAAVCKLSRTVLGSELDTRQLREIYTEMIEDVFQIIMVAEHSGKIVGYIRARRQNDLKRGCYTEISEIALYGHYRRRGCGTMLLRSVEKWSSQMFINNIKCTVKGENEGMSALLRECDYTETCHGAFEKTMI